jgi:hypothetical protein
MEREELQLLRPNAFKLFPNFSKLPWKRSEGEGGELRYFKGRGPLLLRILCSTHKNVEFSMSRM